MILIDHLIFWIFGIADILLCNNIQRQCKIYSITWFECCELVSVWEVSIVGCPQRLARKKHGNVYSAQTMFVFVRYAIMNIFFLIYQSIFKSYHTPPSDSFKYSTNVYQICAITAVIFQPIKLRCLKSMTCWLFYFINIFCIPFWPFSDITFINSPFRQGSLSLK